MKPGDSMRFLIAEDDLISQRLLETILTPYGRCDLADNGVEALAAFETAWNEWDSHDLVCLDIMMPVMDGQEVLRRIRDFEKQQGQVGLDCTKIMMISALDDFPNIKQAFNEQCEAYLVKPIDKDKLMDKLKEIGVIAPK